MEEFLIVDGYNIIGAWPVLKQLKDLRLEDARDKLIEMLSEYQAFSGRTVYIVFDAYQVPGLGVKYEQSKVKILYTKENESADECIERLVTSLLSRRTQVYVATSDSVEQHVIFGKGALRMPARELLTQVKQSNLEIRAKIGEQHSRTSNTFDSRLNADLRQMFEKWRRGKS